MEKPAKVLKRIQVPENEAAEILGVCQKTLYNRRREGRIGYVLDGSRVLYRLEELERYSKANHVAASV